MLILRCSSKLRLLETMLQRDLPDTAVTLPVCGTVMLVNHGNPASKEVLVDSWPEFRMILTRTQREVYGTVMHVNRGNPASKEVLVDSWPEFRMILTRTQREAAHDPSDVGTNLYTAFYRDESACRELLENSDAIDWDQAFQIQGLQPAVQEAISNIAQARGLELELCPYLPVIHPDPTAMFQHRRSKRLRIVPVSPAHTKLVSDAWLFGRSSWSMRYIGHLIRDFPSACLLDPKGHPISWCLSDSMAAMTHAYTLPEHRGQHLICSVVERVAAQLHARGFPLYSRVLPDNVASLRFQKHLGFQTLPGMFYCLIVKPRYMKSQSATALDFDQGTALTSVGEASHLPRV
ncbi:glycine N-acyltransferase-like protein 3 [Carettochelys insculpta]|uniref:glycine N-acyltransferase-like protein 3 n=1 Tax=Carettochelys insculpta TaxID=44489 RepID=UPI003EBE2C04